MCGHWNAGHFQVWSNLNLHTRGCYCRYYHSTSLSPPSGNPAYRGHPGEGLCRRGRAAEGGHCHFRSRPLWCGGLRHGLKQRWARRLFIAMSSSQTPCTPSTYTNTHTNTHALTHTKCPIRAGLQEATYPQRSCSVELIRAGWQIEALAGFIMFFFLFFLFIAHSNMLFRDRQPE